MLNQEIGRKIMNIHELYLPKQIEKYVLNMYCEQNKIGKSQAGVYKFYKERESFYLKVEPKSGELEKEFNNLIWLQDKLPVPQVIEFISFHDTNYLLLSEVKGKMLCDEYYIQNPQEGISILAKGIRLLKSINIEDCPINNSLDVKLRDATENIKHNRVDIGDWEMTTKEAFSSPQNLLDFLCCNKPKSEELTFTHGDYCLANIFGKDNFVKGFIDISCAGVADIWQDIALCIRSVWHNYKTKEYDTLLLRQIGVPYDENKLNYYILLDELF